MLSILFYSFISIFFIIYLLYQSKEDIKDKTVPVLPNNLVVLIFLFIYLLGCLFTWTKPDFFSILVGVFLFFVMVLFRVFGSGDAKAMFAMMLRGSFAPYHDVFFTAKIDFFPVAFTYVVATCCFTPVNIIKGLKNGRAIKDILFGKNHFAFFPYLTIGYIITSVFLIFLTI